MQPSSKNALDVYRTSLLNQVKQCEEQITEREHQIEMLKQRKALAEYRIAEVTGDLEDLSDWTPPAEQPPAPVVSER